MNSVTPKQWLYRVEFCWSDSGELVGRSHVVATGVEEAIDVAWRDASAIYMESTRKDIAIQRITRLVFVDAVSAAASPA